MRDSYSKGRECRAKIAIFPMLAAKLALCLPVSTNLSLWFFTRGTAQSVDFEKWHRLPSVDFQVILAKASAQAGERTPSSEQVAEKLTTCHPEGQVLPERSAFSQLFGKADPSLRSGRQLKGIFPQPLKSASVEAILAKRPVRVNERTPTD